MWVKEQEHGGHSPGKMKVKMPILLFLNLKVVLLLLWYSFHPIAEIKIEKC